VLDSVPKAGSKDLRKTRSALDNIVITSTNAARTLEEVMPEIARIGFMADSVRIPTSTVSLIILNLTFQTDTRADGSPSIDRDGINAIYREASEGEGRGLVRYTEEQNVSADIIGEDAAVIIEASETHTRTGFIDVRVPQGDKGQSRTTRIPVTHVKVFGWYDNEMGSYTFRLGELTRYVAQNL
jgi:glyceraldehyde 3-phosphate dehydrogenase